MAFDCINGILGTGGSKTAGRRKQGGDKELICFNKKQKKTGKIFLQKIFHNTAFPASGPTGQDNVPE
jgi:hypothetical protein